MSFTLTWTGMCLVLAGVVRWHSGPGPSYVADARRQARRCRVCVCVYARARGGMAGKHDNTAVLRAPRPCPCVLDAPACVPNTPVRVLNTRPWARAGRAAGSSSLPTSPTRSMPSPSSMIPSSQPATATRCVGTRQSLQWQLRMSRACARAWVRTCTPTHMHAHNADLREGQEAQGPADGRGQARRFQGPQPLA